MNRSEGITFLTTDQETGEDIGGLRVFGRYGPTTADAAPVAWRLAYLIARETGEPVTVADLDYAMYLVVNEHDDVAHFVRSYGRYDYGRAVS